MKIRLKHNLPISRKEGAIENRTFDVIRYARNSSGSWLYWFIGDTGGECGAYPREVDVIHEDKDEKEDE